MPRLEVSNSDWSMNGREHFDFSSPSLTIRSKPKIFDDCENIGLHLLDSYAENVQCICNGWFEGNEYQWNIFSMKIKNETNNLISWAFKWNWPQKLFGIKTLLKWLSMSAYFQQNRTFLIERIFKRYYMYCASNWACQIISSNATWLALEYYFLSF